jgi:hypothetical protein
MKSTGLLKTVRFLPQLLTVTTFAAHWGTSAPRYGRSNNATIRSRVAQVVGGAAMGATDGVPAKPA